MMQLITCGPDRALNRKLTTLAHDCCRQLQVDSETLLETPILQEAAKAIRQAESTNLCTMVVHQMPAGEDVLLLPGAMDASQHESLLVVLMKDLRYLAELINAGTRLSGVMVSPLEVKTARACYDGVLQRYSLSRVSTGKSIVLHFGRQSYQLALNSILYLEALNKMVQVHTMMQSITISQSLKEISDLLDDRFYQCHRSYIVNANAIKEADYPNMELDLINGARIPFSRSSRKTVMERMQRTNT